MKLHPKEKELVELWEAFLAMSAKLLSGEEPPENAPSAAQMREIRVFLEANEVSIAFITRAAGEKRGGADLQSVPFNRSTG